MGGPGSVGPTLESVVLISPRTGGAKVSWHRDHITIEPRRPFLAFLYTIARNVVTDRIRRERPQASFEDALAHPSDVPGPEELASASDDVRRLRSAVARLTTLQQEVILLRYLEGRSTKETAVVIGKPESTIRGIQMRALAALRDLLGDLSP